MDKFAVDLEKVLDDFEYNEGREETVLPAVIKNLSSHNTQKRHKPPAAVYRRPTFEPINLSDADFSAASIPSTDNFLKAKEDFTVNNNVVYTQPFVAASTETIEIKGTDKENRKLIKNDEILNESNDKETTYSDGTPDLLDSNTLKPNQNNSDIKDANLIINQLPDITSVSNTTHKITSAHTPNLTDETPQSASFDLIKPTAQPISFDEDNLPPIVDVGLVIKENLPEIKVIPISFVSVDTDVSEVELENYLQNLEINDNIECATEVSESVAPETISTTISNESSESVTDTQSDIIVGKYEEEECSLELNKEDSIRSNLEEVGTSGTSQDIKEAKEAVSEISVQPNVTEEKEEIIKEQEYQDIPVIDKINEPDNETLQTMCENIQSVNKKTSSIGDLEIISTQITEYKINEEITRKVEEPVEEEINEYSNVNKTILENFTGTEEILQTPSSSSDNISCDAVKTEQFIEEIPSQQLEEITSVREEENIDDAASDYQQSPNEEFKPNRPSSLALNESNQVVECEESPTPTNTVANNSCGPASPMEKLGKFPPFWVPDTESDYCMQCQNKFTVIRRRHHCRACGLVLCSKCCNLKAPLEYLDFAEARVCQPCFNIIYRVSLEDGRYNLGRQPNPNNPMEYCSTIPPLQQAASTINQPPPSVLVPTGVLKREGRAKSDIPKQVIFSDGIRPGGDLTELDGPSESRILPRRGIRRLATPPGGKTASVDPIIKRSLDPTTQSFIPADTNLPPMVYTENGQLIFSDEIPKITHEPVKFAINYNLFVTIKKVKLDCCVNRLCWSVCSEGLACVGQDEVAIILECLSDEILPPQDLFNLINALYQEASKGTTVSEMCFTQTTSNTLFGSKDHGGFLYIRPTFQCTTNLLLPSQPYLIAILVHRWETPWARLFPLRLVLRLGAEYRYYPCPLVSIRNRQPLYTDIGHTVMKVLVDFRKYSYSLATVRGLLIHMEDRQTTILFPRNRYDQVVRALNNSNESVLAFGANLSLKADSHLVCIQGTKDENTYHTQAINIHNKPRRVTGASFVVFNGALKIPGLSGKSSIMEDGLMVHLPSDSMTSLRTALREMQDYTISCGPNEEETVYLQWTEDDTNFNVGVKSCIDGKPLDGIPSIRVHNGTDYPGNHKIIRWTEVFILQSEDGRKATDPLDISRVSESLARATCMALVPDLDSLAAANLNVLAIRATIHPDSVGYEVGSCGNKLPSVYMKRLDEELVPVIHQAAVASQDTPAVLELTFRVMNHL